MQRRNYNRNRCAIVKIKSLLLRNSNIFTIVTTKNSRTKLNLMTHRNGKVLHEFMKWNEIHYFLLKLT